jgi:hypothetical protein
MQMWWIDYNNLEHNLNTQKIKKIKPQHNKVQI